MALGQYTVGIIYKVEWTAQEQQTRGFIHLCNKN